MVAPLIDYHQSKSFKVGGLEKREILYSAKEIITVALVVVGGVVKMI